MASIWSRSLAIVGLVLTASLAAHGLEAQDKLVDFAKDVRPILEQRCFRCHGGESSEGLDLNDREALADYITAGDPGESDLYQRLVATDESLMPPADEGGPLPTAEIALLKLWIAEGADWPEGVQLGADSQAPTEATPPEPAGPKPHERSTVAKLWAIHGWFHPAVVHFPIALLNVAALFVLLHWLFRGAFREMAFWCLTLGALGAIASCSMGWAFVPERYLTEEEVFRHRWGGIALAVWSSLMAVLAMRLKASDRGWSQIGWQVGVLVAAAGVGIVGHQGGELVYGEGMYDKVIQKYFPDVIEKVPAEPAATEPAPTEPAAPAEGKQDSATTTDSAPTEPPNDSAQTTPGKETSEVPPQTEVTTEPNQPGTSEPGSATVEIDPPMQEAPSSESPKTEPQEAEGGGV